MKSIDKTVPIDNSGREGVMRGFVPTAARRLAMLLVAAALLVPLVPAAARAQDGVTLTLVAYSTPREAYEQIIPLFQATEAGAGIEFETSFAASGEQSRAVE